MNPTATPRSILEAHIDRILRRRTALVEQAGDDLAARIASRPARVGLLLDAAELYGRNGWPDAARQVLEGLLPGIVKDGHPETLARARGLEERLGAL